MLNYQRVDINTITHLVPFSVISVGASICIALDGLSRLIASPVLAFDASAAGPTALIHGDLVDGAIIISPAPNDLDFVFFFVFSRKHANGPGATWMCFEGLEESPMLSVLPSIMSQQLTSTHSPCQNNQRHPSRRRPARGSGRCGPHPPSHANQGLLPQLPPHCIASGDKQFSMETHH